MRPPERFPQRLRSARRSPPGRRPLEGFRSVRGAGPGERQSAAVEYWEELWRAVDPHWEADPPKRIRLEPGFCDYLTGRIWQLNAIWHPSVDRLMELGGQRFGHTYCVTACPRCRACQPARIRVDQVVWTRSQRRTLGRNADLRLALEPVRYTPEKYDLLARFVQAKFGKSTAHLQTEAQREEYYLSFHLHHPVLSREVQYYEGDRLLGVSIVDLGQVGLYSHYFFYDLSQTRRRLGIYSFLREIAWCQQLGYPYLYIGFLNEKTAALRYKAQFAGLEVLRPELGWVRYEPRTERPGQGRDQEQLSDLQSSTKE